MNQLKFSIVILALLLVSSAFAEEEEIYLNKLNYCKLTKSAMNDYEPSPFESTNNLLRKVGQEELYCGEKIIVHGRLLDENCVPIPDATIYAWQANCSSQYPYQPLKNLINQELVAINNEMTFTGNGTATTNSKGEFHFVTIYPPAMHNHASHLNVRIVHNRHQSLQTRLSLRGNKVKNPQRNPELYSISDIAVANDISIYDFEIVLPGVGLKQY